MLTSTCPHCGAKLFGNVSQCYKCGKKVAAGERAYQERERLRSETIENEAQGPEIGWPVVVIVGQGLFELIGLAGFLAGYFLHLGWVMVAGGSLVVLDDIIQIAMGVLNPVFPVLLAIVLAIILTPWYVGIFWASAAFKVLNIPTSFRKVYAPSRFLVTDIIGGL